MTEQTVKRPRGRPRKNQQVDLEKASSEGLAVSRLRMGEIGSLALQRIRDDSERMKNKELKWPNCIMTYESMKLDATVATALNTTYMLVEKPFNDFFIRHKKGSVKSKEAAEFIEYCFKNLDNQTLRQVARSAATMNEYGFAVFEKVFSKITRGKYKDKYPYRLSKLAFRPQGSLDIRQPFKFSDDSRELVGLWQNNNAFDTMNGIFYVDYLKNQDPQVGSVFIPINKILLLSMNATSANPTGVSPLNAAYKAYREKVVIENLEIVGANKNLSGVLELKIPSMILQKAALDPSGKEAQFLNQLMQDAANSAAGEQSFFILPSDVQPGGQEQFKMSLKGVDGGSGDKNTTTLINERKKVILDLFSCGFLNLGNEQVGSYALSEGKQSIHAHYVESNINIIKEGFNQDIIPQLLSLNNIFLEDDEMPTLEVGDVDQVDVGEFASSMQRMKAVGLIPVTVELVNECLTKLGFEYRVPEDTTPEQLDQLLGKMQSRSGDGFSTETGGLNGTGDSVSESDSSISNLANTTV